MSRYARVLTTEIRGAPVVAKRANDRAARSLLDMELRRLRAAAHPGVVAVVATTQEHVPGFATAWAGGATLASTDLPPEDLAIVLAQVCATLADLHDRGFVHGRIDPSHVVLGTDLRPTLCGVGIGPAPTFGAGAAGPIAADDVHAVGRLILRATGTDADEEPTPRHRWDRQLPWTGAIRRALQTLGDRATHPDPLRRPTARELAADLSSLAGSDRRRRRPGRSRVPTDALVLAVGTIALVLSVWSIAGSSHLIDDGLLAGGGNAVAVGAGLLAARVVALVFTASVVASTALAMAAERSGSSHVARWAKSLTLPGVDRLAMRVGGIGLGALVALATPVRAPSTAPASATATASVGSTIERLPDGAIAPRAVPDRAPAAQPIGRATVRDPRTPPPGAARRAEKVIVAASAPSSWTVRRGDHLWSISERTLAQQLGRNPLTAETAAYWQRVVRANPGLDDPDVIVAGQAISLPAL